MFPRSSGLAKTILHGTVKGGGGRRQGRQRERWDDNIREWPGLEFSKSQRVVENVGNWLRNHLWCPKGPRGYGIDERWWDEIVYLKQNLKGIQTRRRLDHMPLSCFQSPPRGKRKRHSRTFSGLEIKNNKKPKQNIHKKADLRVWRKDFIHNDRTFFIKYDKIIPSECSAYFPG